MRCAKIKLTDKKDGDKRTVPLSLCPWNYRIRKDGFQVLLMKNILRILKDDFLKRLLLFLLCQIILMLLFLAVLLSSIPPDRVDIKTETIIVNRLWLSTRPTTTLSIYTNQGIYKIDSAISDNDFSCSKIRDSVSVGDSLDIMYYSGYSWFRPANWIVDVRTESTTYRSIDNFYARKNFLPTTILVVGLLVEILYLGCTFCYFALIRQNIKVQYKVFCKKLRKRKRG